MTLSQELKERGFIHQISCDDPREILDAGPRTVYHGIDPSADSAHAGNFVNWILLKHLKDHGHRIIFLVGGGTGKIGDPKPDAERVLEDERVIQKRAQKLKKQAKHLLGGGITFVDNDDWLNNLNLIAFLRDIGKHFTVSELLKKEAIAKRLSSEVGLSYTEFAYPLLQAFDFLQLYRKYNCDFQVGGSDQWGNIIAGVDLVRRIEGKKVYALTQPLVIDKTTGKKFGKSEGNAVWLDPEKTTPYHFYQFWLNVADENVVDYLKRFTFIPLEEIEHIRKEHETKKEAHTAQVALARSVTTFVHGETEAKKAENVSRVLFGDTDVSSLTRDEMKIIETAAPLFREYVGKDIITILVESGLAQSKREARQFIESGAVHIDKARISDTTYTIQERKPALLRRGKRQAVVLY